jgi:hypothetical protein
MGTNAAMVYWGTEENHRKPIWIVSVMLNFKLFTSEIQIKSIAAWVNYAWLRLYVPNFKQVVYRGSMSLLGVHVSDFCIVVSFPQGCSKLVCSLFEVGSLDSIICFLTHWGPAIQLIKYPWDRWLKPCSLTFALFILKIDIKSPNYLYQLKLLGNTYQGS